MGVGRVEEIQDLRWLDLDLERELIHWRAKSDKTGFDQHSTTTPPVSKLTVHRRWRSVAMAITATRSAP